MLLFDLLFLVLALIGFVTLLSAGAVFFSGRRAQAGRLLRRLGIGIAVYFSIVIVVSILLPRRELTMGDPLCFDDWCVAVTSVQRSALSRTVASYAVTTQVSSRAVRVSQREKDLAVFLTDASGREYRPAPDLSAGAFDMPLGPGDAARVRVGFKVPVTARHLGLIITHSYGFPIDWFIIGYESWFRKPAILRLPDRASALSKVTSNAPTPIKSTIMTNTFRALGRQPICEKSMNG